MDLVVTLCVFLVAVATGDGVWAQANVNTTDNFEVERIGQVARARGVAVDDVGDILVVTQDPSSRITALFERNGQMESVLLLDTANLILNHGIAYRNEFLYASSETTVYRWPYRAGERTTITQPYQLVISGIPDDGHWTRTIIFDQEGSLHVSIGSGTNVDPDSSRARVRRFNITSIPSGGIDFNNGVVVADGVRNGVGLAFDASGVMWCVDNGADELVREDLGGDIHNTNPGDELLKFDTPLGTHFGYPYCWSVDELANHPKGEQLVWPDFLNDGVHSDDWCRNTQNVRAPVLTLPAHYAALGIEFYDGRACNSSQGAFPCSMKGDAFVAFHGSWNRQPPEGYKVVRIPINPDTNLPTGEILDVVFEPNPATCGRCFAPVNAVFDHRGHLIVSADTSGEVFRVTYKST